VIVFVLPVHFRGYFIGSFLLTVEDTEGTEFGGRVFKKALHGSVFSVVNLLVRFL
jgi:hypothetical protein